MSYLKRRVAAVVVGAALLSSAGGIAVAQAASVGHASSVSSSSATASAFSFGSFGWFSGQVVQHPIYHSINICGAGNTCVNN